VRYSLKISTMSLSLIIGVGAAVAQDAEPSDRPADAKELFAKAVALQGRVLQAPIGAKPTERDAWKMVQVGDELGQGTQVRVGLRSSLMLQFGDDAVVQLKPMTLASLDELYQTEAMKRTRIGLAYGAIRGSVREKTLRTDMVIEAPAVTCSKEGTENFGLRTMRGSSAWWAEGPSVGMISVRDVVSGRTERLTFGQLVNFLTQTQTPAKRNMFAQAVKYYDPDNMSAGEKYFNFFTQTGQTITGPGLGAQTWSQIAGSRSNFGAINPIQGNALRDALLRGLGRDGLSILFRQQESRFGTGPLPNNGDNFRRAFRR
jgi:hypothetical protein